MPIKFFKRNSTWIAQEENDPYEVTLPIGFHKREVSGTKISVVGVNTEQNYIIKEAEVTRIEKNDAGDFYASVTEFVEETEVFFSGASTTLLQNPDGSNVDVQNPLPADGDSIYVKDLDVSNCDNGDFSGTVTDYFDSLKTVNSNTTNNNPKALMFWFNRTVYSHSIGIGCDDVTKGFGTDVTVKLLGSGEAVRFTKNYTEINKNSALLEFGSKAFNGFILEFNTATEVCISNITIQKAIEGNMTIHGDDPDGEIQSVNVTKDGDLSISDNSSGLAIAEGKVIGKSRINKFGYAPEFDISDGFVTIWDGAEAGEDYEAMNITYSTTDDIDYLVAQDNADTQLIEIQGLDIDYNMVVQTKSLTGQTPVQLDTPLLRVFRMKNVESVDLRNHIFCYVSAGTTVVGGVPQDGAKVRAVIHGDENQTEMAVYTIPLGKKGYMRSWYASTAGAKKDSKHTIKILARPYEGVFQLKQRRNFTSENGLDPEPYDTPPDYDERTDIELKADTDQDGVGVSAGFSIVLVDK